MNYDIINIVVPYSIIFVYNKGSLLHRLIWKFSKRRVEKRLKYLKKTAHVLLYLRNGRVAEVDGKGLRIKRVRNYNKSKFTVQLGVVSGEINGEALEIFAERAEGKIKYDYIRLIIIAVSKIFGFKKKIGDYTQDTMICTEWCVTAFRAISRDLLPGMEACNVTPLDLIQSEILRITVL